MPVRVEQFARGGSRSGSPGVRAGPHVGPNPRHCQAGALMSQDIVSCRGWGGSISGGMRRRVWGGSGPDAVRGVRSTWLNVTLC
jgi:hypothetical protein